MQKLPASALPRPHRGLAAGSTGLNIRRCAAINGGTNAADWDGAQAAGAGGDAPAGPSSWRRTHPGFCRWGRRRTVAGHPARPSGRRRCRCRSSSASASSPAPCPRADDARVTSDCTPDRGHTCLSMVSGFRCLVSTDCVCACCTGVRTSLHPAIELSTPACDMISGKENFRGCPANQIPHSLVDRCGLARCQIHCCRHKKNRLLDRFASGALASDTLLVRGPDSDNDSNYNRYY